MNKLILIAAAIVAALTFGSCEKTKTGGVETQKTIKIGISKITQHPALDAVEQGIQDGLAARGITAEYDLQNANGDMSTATQIAAKFKAEKVDIAIGIATPTAQALANTIKDIPVIFATVTDPVGAGLVTTLEHGEGNVTGLSDAIPTSEHIALFKKIADINTLGYIYTASEANSASALALVEKSCAENGITLITQSINSSAETRQAAQAIVNRVDGLYLTTDNTVFSGLQGVINVFRGAKKPLFSGEVDSALDGGCLIASGFNYYKAGIVTAGMVAEIIDGKKPADIPVKLLTELSETDFLIDMDAAANCSIEIPEQYIEQANKIFENGTLYEK
ncbi:MAG: ABC transporter substrate-binding protein [Spirochaetaceae bacterium]|jgi:putative ABC transport system substrate-binding protein|nr:ABC transporter substrate-binding protein [Spirochaetaceae bacterium]